MITHTKWREDRRLKKESSYKLSPQAWLTDCHPFELRKWRKSNLSLEVKVVPVKLIYSAADPTIVCRKSPKPQLGHHWPIFRRSWWWGWFLTSNQCLTSCHDVLLKHILRILLSFTDLWTQLGQLRKWKKSNLNLPAKLIYSTANPTIVCRKSPKPQLGHHWPIFRRSWWWRWFLTSNQCNVWHL